MKRLAIGICLIFFPLLTKAQADNDVNLIDLVKEVQQWSKKDNRMSLSWWIPNEYWRISLKDNSEIPPETITHLESAFRDYVIIWACDMTVSLNGSMTFREQEEILKTITISLTGNGKRYYPLDKSKIDGAALSIAESMKPFFAQALGQMGKGIHFFFFKVTDEQSNNLINATLPGEFIVSHSNSEFQWKLPLPALMPPKVCPIDKEKMKGNWKYCPIHGQKLD